MQKVSDAKIVRWVYRTLLRAFGKQYWWPAKTPFEVIVGAILTQGTAWSHVEKSLFALRQSRSLTPRRLYAMNQKTLAKMIRPSGFFRVKAKRLQHFLSYFFKRWGGNLDKMFETPVSTLRGELLDISGLGRETVDSILLYAGGTPTFVVDSYTRRILMRHGLLKGNETYDEIRSYFMKSLPLQSSLFNEYHALLVEVGKRYCRTTPLCARCPLDPLPRTRRGCDDFFVKTNSEKKR